MKVVKIDEETIEFEDGLKLFSAHDQDCCENHWLSFKDLTLEDFKGLDFDLSNDNFFKKIEGYGIELLPINGHSVKIPGYGSNNGYYSAELTLVLSDGRTFDITECQEISE